MTSETDSPGSGPPSIDDLSRALARGYIGLSFPLGVLITVFYGLWAPLTRGDSRLLLIAGNFVLFALYAVAFIFVLRWWLRRRLDRALGWLTQGRPLSATDARALRRLPFESARFVLAFQASVAVLTALSNLASNRIAFEAAGVLVGLLLAAVTFAALAYLVAEHALREVFAQGFAQSPQATSSTVGVRTRLLVAWAAGSAIPLLFILAIPIARDEAGRVAPSPIGPMAVMAFTGLITGAILTFTVSRSISDPLAAVRAALERVGTGSLDEHIPVDDPGEIGLLQVGFNDMVKGLRERRLLHDLFGRHVGEEVARRALRDGVELGGELRDASVLMVDLLGSTALARRVGPEEVVNLLNTFFAAVVTAVATNGGWVNKFEGDAALCVFGVPDHLADHPQRALQAALDLRRELAQLFMQHPDLDAGIGVSSGLVVAGNIGTASRLEYTVIGDAVNEAARLADLAKDLQQRAAASGTIIDSADHPSDWEHTHDTRLRGRDIDTRVFVPTEH